MPHAATSPTPEPDGQPVYLRIPIPVLSTQSAGRHIYHFPAIALADQIRQYLASALANKSYRLSDDAEYIDGVLCFEIVSQSDDEDDWWEAQRVYEAASKDVTQALSYLADPVGTVKDGLNSGQPKAKFQILYSAASDLVAGHQRQPIQAAVVHGTDDARFSGLIASLSLQRAARRQLNPPVKCQLEQGTWTFQSRDSDGVLATKQGELFYAIKTIQREIKLGQPMHLEMQIEKTRISRDVHTITRILREDEVPDK